VRRAFPLLLALLLTCTGCGFFGASGDPDKTQLTVAHTIELASPAFAEGAPIPADFTCQGAGDSPPLQWTGVPAGARSLALVVFDPDAGSNGFTHWVLYDIDPATRSIPTGTVPAGARQALTSKGSTGWVPPCPPSGTHHYVFTLYVLRSPATLPNGSPTAQSVHAIEAKAVDRGQLTGTVTAR
jgi:Raf kinase inhibitor-like YbhB/YbcL family protein